MRKTKKQQDKEDTAWIIVYFELIALVIIFSLISMTLNNQIFELISITLAVMLLLPLIVTPIRG
jgi:hypothetical protein